jgi:hypothetical protein
MLRGVQRRTLPVITFAEFRPQIEPNAHERLTPLFLKRVRKIAKTQLLASSCLSVRRHRTAPTGRILTKIYMYLSKISRENSSFIKIWQEKPARHVKTDVHLWQYLAEFFLQWEMFQTKVVEKIKTHILCSITFLRKSCRLWDNLWKFGKAGQVTDDNIVRRMRPACWITESSETHSAYVILTFPRKQWLRERASMLTHVHCLFLLCTKISWNVLRFRLLGTAFGKRLRNPIYWIMF